MKDGQEVFSAARQTGQTLLHNVEGTLTIPYTFQENGDYTVQVYVAGIGIPAVPTDEEATFPITVVPEFSGGALTAGGNQSAISATTSITGGNTTTERTAAATSNAATGTGATAGNGKSGGPEDPNASLHNSELSKKRQKKIYIPKGRSNCGCNAGWHSGTVLDPFAGSLTTCLVAMELG